MAGFTRFSRPRPRPQFLSVELLEDRCLLSSSTLDPGALLTLSAGDASAPALLSVQHPDRTASALLAVGADRQAMSVLAPTDGPAPDTGGLPLSRPGPLNPAWGLLSVVEVTPGAAADDVQSFAGFHSAQFDGNGLPASFPEPTLLVIKAPSVYDERFLLHSSGADGGIRRADPTADRPLDPAQPVLRAEQRTTFRLAEPWADNEAALLALSRRYDDATEKGPAGNYVQANPGNGPASEPPLLNAPDPSGALPLPAARLAAESSPSPPAASASGVVVVGASLGEARRPVTVVVREPARASLSLPISLQTVSGSSPAAALASVAGAAGEGNSAGAPTFVQRGATAAAASGRPALLLQATGSAAGRAAPDQPGPAAPVVPATKEITAIDLPAQAAALLEGGLPLDVAALGRDVDDFFARLAVLGDARAAMQGGMRFLPWVVLTAGAAFELARRWERKSSRRLAGDESLPGPIAFHPDEER